MNKVRQITASLLVMLMAIMPMATVQAAMITTDAAISAEQSVDARKQLNNLMQEEALQQQMLAMGVDPERVAERISSMTDAEVVALHARMDEMPAGEGILGLAALIFIVFIITDALGATDLFTFVKPIR